MAELTSQQKKEYAQMLFLKENLTQQEIAERVGVSRQTVARWSKEEKWEERKVGITTTREAQIANLYRQIAEINRVISERGEGQRFATPPEADTLGNRCGHCRHHQCGDALHQLDSSRGCGESQGVHPIVGRFHQG